MYKCQDCGAIFYEPDEKHTTYEWEYGVADLFGSSHPLTISICPECGSENIDDYYEEEEDE